MRLSRQFWRKKASTPPRWATIARCQIYRSCQSWSRESWQINSKKICRRASYYHVSSQRTEWAFQQRLLCCGSHRICLWLQTIGRTRYSVCLTCRRRSTASNTWFCSNAHALRSALEAQYSTGFGRFWVDALSRLCTALRNQLRQRYSSAFHTAQSSVRCRMCYTRLHCSTSLNNIGLTLISTPTTCSCICASRRPKLSVATDSLNACLLDVETWLKASRLRLYPSKPQIMWLGSAQQLAKVRIDEVSEAREGAFVPEGITSKFGRANILGQGLWYREELRRRCWQSAVNVGTGRSCLSRWLLPVRQLRPLKRCMTDEAINTLMHAFISSRLGYC